MKIYYHDNIESDSRLAHDSGEKVDEQYLKDIGVLAYHFENIEDVDAVAKERKYVNRDTITITPEGLGGQEIYEQKLKIFYTEHLHEDEEIRYILDGDGYFDVRNGSDKWIRVHMVKGDLLILPAGIYHRFTLSDKDYIKAMRLFQDEPKWIPHNRPCDENEYRVQYLNSISGTVV
jgi:1,2-dihydroxy-3-keto-5-methylthiopentene dioxygenase